MLLEFRNLWPILGIPIFITMTNSSLSSFSSLTSLLFVYTFQSNVLYFFDFLQQRNYALKYNILEIFTNLLYTSRPFHLKLVSLSMRINISQWINTNFHMLFLNFQAKNNIMISSIRYVSRSAILDQSMSYVPHKRFVFQILLIKCILLAFLFVFPPIMNQQVLCIIITSLAALDFWVTKTLGRKFLNIHWYINTDQKDDEWIYQASLRSPVQAYQQIFWYSFIMYGLMLLAVGIVSLTDSKLSLACAILIGFVANYINFYAFSSIIQLRNEGILQQISEQVNCQGIQSTIRLPLAYKSKLADIPEQNQIQYAQSINPHIPI